MQSAVQPRRHLRWLEIGLDSCFRLLVCTLMMHHPGRRWWKQRFGRCRASLKSLLSVNVGWISIAIFPPRDAQARAFDAQLAIAADVGLPVFLHERDATQRFREIATPWRERLVGGVVHCLQ